VFLGSDCWCIAWFEEAPHPYAAKVEVPAAVVDQQFDAAGWRFHASREANEITLLLALERYWQKLDRAIAHKRQRGPRRMLQQISQVLGPYSARRSFHERVRGRR